MPLALFAPLHALLAVHEVGLLVALQLNVALLPVPIEVGFTDTVTTGGLVEVPDETLTVDVAISLPPALLHVSV